MNKSNQKTSLTDWLPLLMTFAVIAGLTVAVSYVDGMRLYHLVTYGMGFFFVIFALFKLIDIKGFAMGYAEYDLISKKWYAWGYIYPFIELVLGFLYILKYDQVWLHILTAVLSLLICVGVLIKLAKKELVKCLCLGTVLKIPLTSVSLLEYFVMGIMAVAMLFR